MLYLDTSVIVAALGGEVWSVDVAEWIAGNAHECAVSAWVGTEYSNVVARRVRMGQFDTPQQSKALQAYATVVESLAHVAIIDSDFRSAAQYVDRVDLGLRAPDALHLAVAKRHACQVVTLDRGMRDAAQALEVPIRSMRETDE